MTESRRLKLPASFIASDHPCNVVAIHLSSPLASIIVEADNLTDIERVRADKFHFTIDRNRFVIGRCIARQGLGNILRCTPAQVPIALDNGRPYLTGNKQSVFFNISHSGEWVAVAFNQAEAIGFDVEQHRTLADMPSIAKRVMDQTEYTSFCDLPEQEKAEHFFCLWSRKEAVLKLMGSGFTVEPEKVHVGMDIECHSTAHYKNRSFGLLCGYWPKTQNHKDILAIPHSWCMAVESTGSTATCKQHFLHL